MFISILLLKLLAVLTKMLGSSARGERSISGPRKQNIFKARMRCPFIMTSEYENRYEDRKRKTLDDIYRGIKSIDGKVEDILDELRDCEYGTRDYDSDWTMRDFCGDEEVY